MSKYTVNQLSKLAGVSIRTLHHYDEIDLLKPGYRGESRYRYYGQEELLRLQQILFYRELDYPLKEIKKVLDDPDFDLIESLEFHKEELIKRSSRLKLLLNTIDKTIVKLKKQEIMKDQEIYEGFPKGKEYREEAIERWGEQEVMGVETNIKAMGKDQYKQAQAEGDAICHRLAKLMDKDPADALVQVEVGAYHKYLCRFYEVSLERYSALSEMYVTDERFKAHFDKFDEGLAEFLNQGIQIYVESS